MHDETIRIAETESYVKPMNWNRNLHAKRMV
uniref:Uncharacterized protein n=1 Tax=Rhizophora mucronata TaxID=61149 RepID=A0A2P2QAX3_RHIMU